jgi:integrase
MPKAPTSKRSHRERTGVERLYKYSGIRKVSFYYQYPDGSNETLASADAGDRAGIQHAARIARRRALELQEGNVVAGSVSELIERFQTEIAPTHFRDQSHDGLAVRKGELANLVRFFGKMSPTALRPLHGYQYLEARAKSGAPAKANKELSLMSTICNFAVRWGLIEANPFVRLMRNRTDKQVRIVTRSQIVRFYLWSLRQPATFRNLGCAAMFTYLTGFRAAEVRPFPVEGLCADGVRVLSAKRKRGEIDIVKVREWSPKLRAVTLRAKQTHKRDREYLFANGRGRCYSRSGWGSVWYDAMFAWIASFDPQAASALLQSKAAAAQERLQPCTETQARNKADNFRLIDHPAYFSLLDVRPAAITSKLRNRTADAYDFAAHANPSTTHQYYDRRQEKRARATE